MNHPTKKILIGLIAAILLATSLAAAQGAGRGRGSETSQTDPQVETTTTEDAPSETEVTPRGKPQRIDNIHQVGERTQEGNENQTEGGQTRAAVQQRIQQANQQPQGRLMSAAQRMRQEQFMLMQHQLKATGYHGNVSDFAQAFNRHLHQLKDRNRNRINESTDGNLTRKVVMGIASRELAAERLRLMTHLNITDQETIDEIHDILADRPLEEEEKERLRQLVGNADQRFRQRVHALIQYGTEEEKAEFKERVRQHMQERRLQQMAEQLKARRNRFERIRERLQENQEVEGILVEEQE